MAITKLALNGVEYEIGNRVVTEGPQLYEGRELTEYSWAQLKEKCATGNYSDLRIGDYKILDLTSGEQVKAQIAGIDTYRGTYSGLVGHHIDWISKDCLSTSYPWNDDTSSGMNNGTAEENKPYIASTLYQKLTTDVYDILPSDLKSNLKEKFVLCENRYSESGVISDSTKGSIVSVGYVWIPSEYEVFGSIILGTNKWSAGGAVQYPIFSGSWSHRLKGIGNNGSAGDWWLMNPMGGAFNSSLVVSKDGFVDNISVSENKYIPLCFRIAE
jgi:hypothetical protein